MNDHNTGSVYGNDPRTAEGYTANIGPATAPLSVVGYAVATANPYETNKTEYDRLLKEVSDMERRYPDLKGRVNLVSVDPNNMSAIKSAISDTERLVSEKEGQKLQEAVVGGAVALTGLGLAAEAAAGMGGKSPIGNPLGNIFGAEAAIPHNSIEEARRNNPETEKLLASLTPEQRQRYGVEGGQDVSRAALFTGEITPLSSPGMGKQQDRGYNMSLVG